MLNTLSSVSIECLASTFACSGSLTIITFRSFLHSSSLFLYSVLPNGLYCSNSCTSQHLSNQILRCVCWPFTKASTPRLVVNAIPCTLTRCHPSYFFLCGEPSSTKNQTKSYFGGCMVSDTVSPAFPTISLKCSALCHLACLLARLLLCSVLKTLKNHRQCIRSALFHVWDAVVFATLCSFILVAESVLLRLFIPITIPTDMLHISPSNQTRSSSDSPSMCCTLATVSFPQ